VQYRAVVGFVTSGIDFVTGFPFFEIKVHPLPMSSRNPSFLLISLLCALGTSPASGENAPADSSVHREFMRMYAASEVALGAEPAPRGYTIQPLDRSRRNLALTREVFGYLPYWFRARWTQLDYQLVSTVAYFSGEVNADGTIGDTHGWPKYAGDPSAVADVVNMINTAHANGVRVVLCFTNFTSADIDALVSTPSYRTAFIQQALTIVQAGNGDGININFEGINSGSKNALTQFMQALADSFHTRMPGSQVSCAPTDFDTRAGDWDLPALYGSVDLFFFQGYGYGWSGTSTTRPVGLLPNNSFWGSLNITTFIDFVQARIPSDKTVLGVPHFGYRWPAVSGEPKAQTQGTGAVIYYPDALGYIGTYGRLWEQSALNAWFRYQAGAQWYQGWYDDPESMAHKYQFVIDRNLMGVGMWALGMDAGNHDIWDVLAQYMTDSGYVPQAPSAPRLAVVRDTSTTSAAELLVRWESVGEGHLGGFRLYLSQDPDLWPSAPHLDETVLTSASRSVVIPNLADRTTYYVRMLAVDSSRSRLSDTSDTYAARTGTGRRYLVVDGFDRTTGSYGLTHHDFGAQYVRALSDAGWPADAADNDAVQRGMVTLSSYAGVVWFLGDESVADLSLNPVEQALIQDYLRDGGHLCITGSEIGYDLGRSASPNYAPAFYTGYLKATYAGDDAAALAYTGTAGSAFEGESGSFGSVYPEDYPDYITPTGGAISALMYSASLTAGVQFAGTFDTGTAIGKLVYIGFALETIGSPSSRTSILGRVLLFFEGSTDVAEAQPVADTWELRQNFPNPFNPETTIEFVLPDAGIVWLRVFDILGREVALLEYGHRAAGIHRVAFDATGLPSGSYFAVLSVGGRTAIRKMTLLR